jgi:enamine deaminase RidA (YjgF/YER057c/UK114 family)
VVKCSVFLADAADFPAMNEVYAAFFGENRPTRTTVQSVLVEPKMKVEIDCVAYTPKP